MIENRDDFMTKLLNSKQKSEKTFRTTFIAKDGIKPSNSWNGQTKLVSLMLSRITKYPYAWGQSFPSFENLVEG